MLVVLPPKGELSVSSLSSLITTESTISTRESSTVAGAKLNLPPSSWNFNRYVPGNAGAITSEVLPETASIISWASWNVALLPVWLVCLT